jgi:murein DD-endopeptidase MepM/ murein hydrolase activator NlpD
VIAPRRGAGRGDGPGRGPFAVVALALALGIVVLATLGADLLGASGGSSTAGGAGGAGASTPDGEANGKAPTASGVASPSETVLVTLAPASGPPVSPPAPATASPGSPDPGGGSPLPSTRPAPTPSAPDASPGSPTSSAAPASAHGFRPTSTVVPMGMPFRPGTSYRFGDGFRRPRNGVVYAYNLIRGVAPDGTLLRAHDGQDILVPLGTIVVAPLGGVVVDPATVLRPWDPARYGKVIAIRSTEASSAGYTVLMAHLSRQSVAIGTAVRRGQVVGRTGRTGNALESLPHLHIEIRAPFEIRYGYGGVIRRVAAFDILPSLRAAAAGR